MHPSILTIGGTYFDFTDPINSAIDIEVIAHALSNICRFTGHTNGFYSVAQHSVHVSSIVPAKYQLAALLHDASEAYLGDVSAPLKSILPEYRDIEKTVESAIFKNFGFQFPLTDECAAHIKHADMKMLITEKRDLMPTEDSDWYPGIDPVSDMKIVPMPPAVARTLFLNRFYELMALEYAK